MRQVLVAIGLAALAAAGLSACKKEGCLGGEAGCRVPSPCQKVSFSCSGTGALVLQTLDGQAAAPGGWDSLGARGDVLIGNDQVVAVIAGLGNQNYLDPNGGSLLDLGRRGKNNDGLNQVQQAVGIMPRDTARYTSMELFDESPTRVAVQLKGTLDGMKEIPIYTLYEIRPCDPGIRVRTEVFNGTPDPQLWALADGFYWSDREAIPFSPEKGRGFYHPSFSLFTIDGAYERFPYLAATTHTAPYASYAEVGCNARTLEGFQSAVVSTAGLPKTVILDRDYQVYERFLAVADSADAAGAIDLASAVRSDLWGERFVRISGRVAYSGALGSEREASILVSEGRVVDGESGRTPWNQAVPSADGTFSLKVPAGKRYVLEVYAFGHQQVERELEPVAEDLDIGTLDLPTTVRLTTAVSDSTSGAGLDAEVFLVPLDQETRNQTQGSLHENFEVCSPWLGPPTGASPACNRFLVQNGQATVDVPSGRYHVYAFKGPFWTLGHKAVDLLPGSAALSFTLRKLPLQPPGSLSADLHVHGAASFDSSIPDMDRVLSFAATDLEVIVATDHDVVYDYQNMVWQLGLQDRLSVVAGVETTGHIPFLKVPGDPFPRVIGHYNFWPLRFDPLAPRKGGVYDELLEPGELFDRVDPLFVGNGVIQLNHPLADNFFGRDMGFASAIGIDLGRPLPDGDDGTRQGLYVRSPAGGHRNNDHDSQEVMNGTSNELALKYRAFWFYLLNQGELHAGVANSDSHGLTDNTVGIPRNLVFAPGQAGGSFQVDPFNEAVKRGRSLGTNGPVIEAQLVNPGLAPESFGLELCGVLSGAALRLKVSAAPWVPIEEIRFVVNGQVVRTLDADVLAHPTDPFGATGLVRYEGTVPLSEIVGGPDDAWLVVEAGSKLPLAADLGGGEVTSEHPEGLPDGIPDTSDNNGDGVVDQGDVEKDSSEKASIGPLRDPPAPEDASDPRFHFAAVVTGGYPLAFTNPFLLDMNSNGRFDPPGLGGSTR